MRFIVITNFIPFYAIDVFNINLFTCNSRSKEESPISAENLYYDR